MIRFSILTVSFFLHYYCLTGQTDTIPPVLTCSAPPSLNIVGGMATLWPSNFIDTLYDNQTATEQIETGIRKTCSGEGFPENQPNAIVNWEKQVRLEIWARDQAGNTSNCRVQVNVNYLSGSDQLEFRIVGIYGGDLNQGFEIKGSSCEGDSFLYVLDNAYVLGNGQNLHEGDDFEVMPFKNDYPLIGVTTYDLVLIKKHILNLEPLNSPYKILAADANLDGKVTLIDIILLQRLILGYDNHLPHGKSWRFVPDDYIFPDPADPFAEDFPDRIRVDHTENPLDFSPFKFRAIKLGDVNGSATMNE